ncbi:MAG: hypothetical protein E7291_00410 [Lachnospiraceae bacterium]|nr:hypothetical protein [Lachnospiraceae bacterium]
MAQENEKEIQQLKNRIRDLADKAFTQNMFTFTAFLGLSEQDAFWQLESEIRYAGYTVFGGCEDADRRMIRFGNAEELGYEVPFPIACIHITPLIAKFADKLSHRDCLGALMNLGIERSTIGDIKVGEGEVYLFCLDTMAEYICQNLQQIKHTHVKCSVTETYEDIPQEEPQEKAIQISSIRADAVIAKVYNKSRGDCLELFRAGKVFINGRLCENNSRQLKAGEAVNVRGYGKFIYKGEPRETRKGKLSVEVAVYR